MADITRTTPKEQLPEFLHVEEAAAFLDCGRTLIYEMVKDGRLPSRKFGRLVRVTRDGLLAVKS